MAFTYTVEWKEPRGPHQKGFNYSGRIYEVGGQYTNGVADTGGVIDLNITGGFKDPTILWADAIDSSGAAAIQVQLNTPSQGKVTITTTADHDGHWRAKVQSI